MDLFVINRAEEQPQQTTNDTEKTNLDRVLRQIERKKQHRIRQREREKERQFALRKQEEEVKKSEDDVKPTDDDTKNTESEIATDSKPPIRKRPLKGETPAVDNFTILGADTVIKKQKAERVLPQWLAKPTVISSNLKEKKLKVSKVDFLDHAFRKMTVSNGIKYFFPVQAAIIPWLLKNNRHRHSMAPRDLCVCAPTGSGKTLAFVLPIVQFLKHYTVRQIRALVILPTQDLAEQVFKTFKLYTQGTMIEVGLVSGKHQFNIEQNQLVYYNESFGFLSKVHILVCTAGRLVSHLKLTEGFNLKHLQFLVIDEADRVLENVQDDWLYHLEKHIVTDDCSVQSKKILNLCTLKKHRSPQKLLFSATLTQDPEKIEKLSLFQPKLFTTLPDAKETVETVVGKYITPQELTEKYILCSKDLKPLVLYRFLKSEKLTRTIVFTHSAESTHRLKILLQSLFKNKRKIEELSSNLKGTNRDALIRNFTQGEIDVLICTDFLARGIDLPDVKCVISYSAPKYLKTYIHRVGRTARAGESGLAVTILHNEQMNVFKNLLNQMKKDIEQVEINEEDLEKLSNRYKKSLVKLKEEVDKEDKVGIRKIISKKKATKKLNQTTVQ